ncbi:MAG TPA: HNH endonuclease signature motif containing protein [Candidatus Paceibacterota bacterium]|nr:HNH endonuclease signature motif containing protein [Candidatus Paceibacterota bacterium]HMO82726.1 HNH endonuclease signature motif containing protein [Candidatus Paceibacterota bacterium]
MIQLNKGAEPNVLAINKVRWLQEWEATGFTDNKIRDRYRHPDVKQALINATSGKCGYCESKIAAIAYENIEHILPKSVRKDLVFEWQNMVTACPVCNTNKGDYHSDESPLINPYSDNPNDHVTFQGPYIKSSTEKGRLTGTKLDLNRAELILRRAERLKLIDELVSRYNSELDQQKKVVWREQIERELLNDKEYSAMLNGYVGGLN